MGAKLGNGETDRSLHRLTTGRPWESVDRFGFVLGKRRPGDPRVEHNRIEIGTVGPVNGPQIWMDCEFSEPNQVLEWSEDTLKVNDCG